jgi:ADP-heptose:LPS heptosyltransferase
MDSATTRFFEQNTLARTILRSIALAAKGIVNTGLRIGTHVLWPRRRPRTARRILVHRVGFIGDTICAVPALRAIRDAYPDAELTLLTATGHESAPGAQDLLAHVSWIDRIESYVPNELRGFRGARDYAQRLGARGYDLWIELPQHLTTPQTELRNMLFARWVGAPWATGFVVGNVRWLGPVLAKASALHRSARHESDRLLSILERSAFPTATPRFELDRSTEAHNEARAILRDHGLGSRPLLAITPGAKRPANRWPVDRFATIAARWEAEGGAVIVLGAPGDHTLGERIRERAAATVNLCGRTTIITSAELLRCADVLVTNDTGTMHVAAAVRTRCVVAFSARDVRGRWSPYGEGHTVLRSEPACSPCWKDECPYDNRCLTDIETESVWRAVWDRQALMFAENPGREG